MKRVVIAIDGSCLGNPGVAVGPAFCDAVNMNGCCKGAHQIGQTTGWS
jgi:hypothetical protein